MVFSRKLTKKEIEILLKLQEFIKQAHAESSSHDFAHVLSVLRYAIQIGKDIKESVDPFVVCAGALLHDIGKTNSVFSHIHGLFGGSLAEEFLDGLKINSKLTEKICRVVIRHTPTSMIPPESAEEMIVFDADTMDRLGLMGLLRGFIGKEGSMGEILNKYMDKRLDDYSKLHYDVSKRIGDAKNQEMEFFIELIQDRLNNRMKSIEHIFKSEGLHQED
ncbi:HD domain-containing protein [Promethearchaeum syntrophicum]|uniref:HD domain-containing protein n=1 Tax=Promethearchaeum syntrophicum TaxID=2594042 RepID=A0A5B9DEL9_9ARCH|nr:HD domain-containing protein [Candidatus Prometheoarchaeum syntrophicum]QEE17688.1 putative hydrolase [Candidatus Prometheoarchaeum syntrophicum]